jgi:hypothetical protein
VVGEPGLCPIELVLAYEDEPAPSPKTMVISDGMGIRADSRTINTNTAR